MLRVSLLLIATVMLLLQASPGNAQRLPGQPNGLTNPATQDIRRGPQANVRIGERQAAELARQRFAGNILRISLVGQGANQQYQIRMEDKGKVFTVYVNATTGQVSGGG